MLFYRRKIYFTLLHFINISEYISIVANALQLSEYLYSVKLKYAFEKVRSKELYTGMPNSEIHILCTVHCERNVNKLSAHRSWRERTKALMWYYSPLAPLPSKMMRCPWILCFDLLPLQYTVLMHEIWRFLVYISWFECSGSKINHYNNKY